MWLFWTGQTNISVFLGNRRTRLPFKEQHQGALKKKHQKPGSKLLVVPEAHPIWWLRAGVQDAVSILLMVTFGWVWKKKKTKTQTSTQMSFGSRNYCVRRHLGTLACTPGVQKPASHRAVPMPTTYLSLTAWALPTLRNFSTHYPVLHHSCGFYSVDSS